MRWASKKRPLWLSHESQTFFPHLDAILAYTSCLAAFVFSWSFSQVFLSGRQIAKQGGIWIIERSDHSVFCQSLQLLNQIYLPSMFALNDLGKVPVQGYTCKRRGGDVIHLELSTSLLTGITIRKYPVVHFPFHKTCIHLYRETTPTLACTKMLCC